MPRERGLALEADVSGRGATCDDERPCAVGRRGGHHCEDTRRIVVRDALDIIHDDGGPQVLGLFLHSVGERETVGMRDARIVIDLAREDHLPTHGFLLKGHTVKQRPCRIDGCAEPGRATTDDHKILDAL